MPGSRMSRPLLSYRLAVTSADSSLSLAVGYALCAWSTNSAVFRGRHTNNSLPPELVLTLKRRRSRQDDSSRAERHPPLISAPEEHPTTCHSDISQRQYRAPAWDGAAPDPRCAAVGRDAAGCLRMAAHRALAQPSRNPVRAFPRLGGPQSYRVVYLPRSQLVVASCCLVPAVLSSWVGSQSCYRIQPVALCRRSPSASLVVPNPPRGAPIVSCR